MPTPNARRPTLLMFLTLHDLCIELSSSSDHARAQWQQLFAGWLQPKAAAVHARLHLSVQDELPDLPATTPYFSDALHLTAEPGILTVYRDGDEGVWLHYLDGALVYVPMRNAAGNAIRGVILLRAMDNGRFEDVTFTSLAPALRRHGYFLVHAFAASKNGRCALIVGTTNSGKTTTGLNLLLNGWQLLANDIVLLQQRGREVHALPTPGIVNIRPRTVTLLPQLRPLLASKQIMYGQYNITGEELVNGRWSAPCPVTHIYFPYIEPRPHSTRHERNRAVALAHLMAESMDRWDEDTLPEHLNLLQRLVRQANAYEIHLGQDMTQIPPLFES